MGGDSRFDILGEVGIDSRGGVSRHPGDALGDFAAHGFRRADDGYRMRVPLDDDLGSGLDQLRLPFDPPSNLKCYDTSSPGTGPWARNDRS